MKIWLMVGAVLAPVTAAMAADESKISTLSPVIVTATRSDESENRLPAAVTVITREQIERSGAGNVVDALRSSGATQITDLYGDGSRAQVDIRGFGDTFLSNTLILVDGRRLNNPDMAAPDLSSIPLKDVERIEIIEGSAATLYGDQAVGGVINIITRSIDKTNASLEASAGSYSNFGVRAQGGQRIGDFAYRLSAEERGSDNYRDHNRAEYRNFFGNVEYNYGDNSRVFAEAGNANERLQLPGALTAAQLAQNRRQVQPGSGGDYADTRTKNFRVGLDQELFAAWSFLAEATHRESHADAVLVGNFSTQNREINALTPRLTGKFGMPNGDAHLTFGVDVQKARYNFDLPAFAFAQRNTQLQRDAYTQFIMPLPATLEATIGGRVSRVDNDAGTLQFGDTAYAGEAGLAWKPIKPLRVFARYEKNFRFAKVDEFTFVAANCQSGKPLCTQTGKSYELGSEWKEKRWSAAASLYRLDLNNEIAFDPTANPFGGANANLPPTRRDGQTLKLGWQALDRLNFSATYQHVDARVLSGALTGKNIPMVASQTGSLAADVDLPWWALVLHAETLVTSSRAFGGDFNNNLGPLAGYTTTNLALSRNTGTWQFTARVNNVFDTDYAEYGAAGGFPAAQTYYPSPGINGLLTVRYVYQ